MSGPTVVLISPGNASMLEPRIGPPLGLLYLVAWARKHGWDVSDWHVTDHNIECWQPDAPVGHNSHDFSIDRCMRETPGGADIYGTQLASMQMPFGVRLSDRLREREPNAIQICGGSHASAMPEECTEWFDVVVEREGEKPFLSIVAAIAAGLRTHDEIADALTANGHTVRRGHQGRVIVQASPVEPLDDLPFAARDFLDFGKYTRKVAGERATNIITTRGCPARCGFCQQSSLWGNGLRMQSAPRILAEVDNIKEVTGITNLLFLDDSLTARKKSDMVALCHGLRERGVKWRGWTRANLIAKDGEDVTMKLMADSGCQAICIGVEAGTDKVLKAMNKGTNVAQNELALKRVAEAGMEARCSIMVGAPNETWEDVEALIKFVERMHPWVTDWILSSYVPLPGTPDWDDPDAGGFIIDKAKARRELYRHFFVVGGDERSGLVHSYKNGTTPEDIETRHDWVQETLLRSAPRDRILVTTGRPAA